ncbi:hypothetical protein EDD11_002624 [Mortierella claussenii]|nr:hypothetical protein EDD11_002624 [Mortierella claussenii]
MSFSSQTPVATPAWTDCFATDDGRIVVVGGSFQALVYNIGSKTWSDPAISSSSLNFGPNVASNVFLNPVYIQSKILADGVTALVVCTLTWNSQPQPYYFSTDTWTITLAIGTSKTTPPASSSSSSGWGSIPGGGTLLPPAGFRHFTLAILGQDKDKGDEHYGNGRAFIVGGYSTMITGSVQDWDALTSFPVQQAPSNTMVMFGNSGSLSKATRGSAAHPLSPSVLGIFPGNAGGSSTQQQVEIYDANKNIVSMLSDIAGGPRNTIFRASTQIGQGHQIFVHGGVTTLEFGAGQTNPSMDYLTQTIGVFNGDTQQWGDDVNIFVPKKTYGLMIGLIVGGITLLASVGVGAWYFRKRRRQRQFEEEERETKGMVLKDEDNLQKEHRASQPYNTYHDLNDRTGFGGAIYQTRPGFAGAGTGAYYEPLPPPTRESLGDVHEIKQSIGDLKVQGYPAPEVKRIPMRPIHGPQEYPLDSMENALVEDTGGPSHYQPVVTVTEPHVYGTAAAKSVGVMQFIEPVPARQAPPALAPNVTKDLLNHQSLWDSMNVGTQKVTHPDIRLPMSSTAIRTSPHLQAVSSGTGMSPAPSKDSYFRGQIYSNASSVSFGNSPQSPYMSSPTFSTTHSVPDSLHGSDSAQRPLIHSQSSVGDFAVMDSNQVYIPATTYVQVSAPAAIEYHDKHVPGPSLQSTPSSPPPTVPVQTRPIF